MGIIHPNLIQKIVIRLSMLFLAYLNRYPYLQYYNFNSPTFFPIIGPLIFLILNLDSIAHYFKNFLVPLLIWHPTGRTLWWMLCYHVLLLCLHLKIWALLEKKFSRTHWFHYNPLSLALKVILYICFPLSTITTVPLLHVTQTSHLLFFSQQIIFPFIS